MRLSWLVCGVMLVLAGCGDGRWAPGYLINDRGEALSATDENKRAVTIDSMTNQLNEQLGPHWRSDITITELPRYERERDSAWMWEQATVTVTLIGNGKAPLPVKTDEVTTAVRDYLWSQVVRPRQNLHITTHEVVDAARFAPVVAPATIPAAVTPASNTPRTYTVQTGDTWADLSTAFYGTAQHWRFLHDANQGGDLTAGRTLSIPPLATR